MPEKVIFMDFFPSSISCLPRISFYWLILAASPQQRGHKVAWPLLYRWSSNSAGTTSWERLASWLLPQSTLNGCYYCSKSRVFCAHVLSHSGSIPAIDLQYKSMILQATWNHYYFEVFHFDADDLYIYKSFLHTVHISFKSNSGLFHVLMHTTQNVRMQIMCLNSLPQNMSQ